MSHWGSGSLAGEFVIILAVGEAKPDLLSKSPRPPPPPKLPQLLTDLGAQFFGRVTSSRLQLAAFLKLFSLTLSASSLPLIALTSPWSICQPGRFLLR
ncbi:hypothetical protein CBS76997_2324 [Aspergillus niger]|nr:hypothetical protein CBS13152_2398 [Aspergillus niger]KAI3049715.1 hypothetical protein CBS76997_2324 [Aspergillus niger]